MYVLYSISYLDVKLLKNSKDQYNMWIICDLCYGHAKLILCFMD